MAIPMGARWRAVGNLGFRGRMPGAEARSHRVQTAFRGHLDHSEQHGLPVVCSGGFEMIRPIPAPAPPRSTTQSHPTTSVDLWPVPGSQPSGRSGKSGAKHTKWRLASSPLLVTISISLLFPFSMSTQKKEGDLSNPNHLTSPLSLRNTMAPPCQEQPSRPAQPARCRRREPNRSDTQVEMGFRRSWSEVELEATGIGAGEGLPLQNMWSASTAMKCSSPSCRSEGVADVLLTQESHQTFTSQPSQTGAELGEQWRPLSTHLGTN